VPPQSDDCEKNCCKFGYADCRGAGVPVEDVGHLDDEVNNGSNKDLTLDVGMKMLETYTSVALRNIRRGWLSLCSRFPRSPSTNSMNTTTSVMPQAICK
jgi:hypothetical protein